MLTDDTVHQRRTTGGKNGKSHSFAMEHDRARFA